MGDKLNGEYFEAGTTTFNNFNNVTGGADSASGGSGGSGMDCLPLRTPPEPFHYLISEQAKSLVALQELQNEVGALLEFRDLVIETFPNLRSKMPPSTPASSARRDWEPGVRVRRKLAAGTDSARAKPQPSVQDSGFSTETSCGKDAHSSASASASASRSRPMEDELWALLDVIQRKGGRLRDEAEQLRTEIDVTATAEESFARAMQACDCGDLQRLRAERDALLSRAASLEARAALPPASPASPPTLGRLDAVLSPARPPRHPDPDNNKFAAILLESNPVELQRQLLTSTVHNQVLCERLRRAAEQRTILLEKLERERDLNEDLKFRLEEKSIELEGARARMRQMEGAAPSSMRDMEPLAMPSAESRRRPSRIPLHTAHKSPAPRAPPPAAPAAPGAAPPRPASAHSVRSSRSTTSVRRSAVPVRRSPTADKRESQRSVRSRPLPAELRHLAYDSPQNSTYLSPNVAFGTSDNMGHGAGDNLAYVSPNNLALELSRSILYEGSLSPPALWRGRPQRYFESMHYADPDPDLNPDPDPNPDPDTNPDPDPNPDPDRSEHYSDSLAA